MLDEIGLSHYSDSKSIRARMLSNGAVLRVSACSAAWLVRLQVAPCDSCEIQSMKFVEFRLALHAANSSPAEVLSLFDHERKIQGFVIYTCHLVFGFISRMPRPLIPKYSRYHRTIVLPSHFQSNWCARPMERSSFRSPRGGFS